jgi:programmed cell death 6-interacting protein
LNKAQKALAEAQKDNDFIYHERVPDVKNLDPVGKAPLAKTLAIPERLGASFKGYSRLIKKTKQIIYKRLKFQLSIIFLDLFEGLTPVAVHQAMAAWDVRKMEIINVEVGRMREANQMLNG